MAQLVNKFLILALMFSLGCASVTTSTDKTSIKVGGKASASITCTEATETEPKTCTTQASGEGLTENAVEVISKFFETLIKIPGAVARTAGGALP